MNRRTLLKGITGVVASTLIEPSALAEGQEREGVGVWHWLKEDVFWERSWRSESERKYHIARVYRRFRSDLWTYHVRLDDQGVYVPPSESFLTAQEAMDAADACLKEHGIDLSNPVVFGLRKALRVGSRWKFERTSDGYPHDLYEVVEVQFVSPDYTTIQFKAPKHLWRFYNVHTVSTDGFLESFVPVEG